MKFEQDSIMASISDIVKAERAKLGLNQSEFGLLVDLIMTDVSKVENGKKKFPFDKLQKLSEVLKMNYSELKNIYVAEKLAEEAIRYECNDNVFQLAEKHSNYLRMKNSNQGKFEL